MQSNTRPLNVLNVSKFYGSSKGIANISLELSSGEIFGFLGPNGAGKTTTIRTIMNFIKPTSGSIKIFGLDSVSDSDQIKQMVGYLSGELALYDDMTGRQLLEYLGALNADTVDQEYVNYMKEMFDANLDKKLRELSKGNRQKIGIIQAFMHKPKLLILDEPTSGLDPLMQEKFFELLISVKKQGSTVFFSSHNIAEVQRVSDRVGFIKDGELIGIEEVSKLRGLDVHQLKVRFGEKVSKKSFENIEGIEQFNLSGIEGWFEVRGSVDPFIKELARHNVVSIERQETALEDIFMKYYQSTKGES
ncbi:MAG: ABC transporter ATP-binding protein [Candidatus Nomurabacteria bacterium]|nr:ABC transporter ATP-binding protein [Candidatus Saccharibacteria bacterium]USN95367.1 MAG: ABC transporter ATP-binding protein [Candidatus Nomurabacteria bacterium]